MSGSVDVEARSVRQEEARLGCRKRRSHGHALEQPVGDLCVGQHLAGAVNGRDGVFGLGAEEGAGTCGHEVRAGYGGAADAKGRSLKVTESVARFPVAGATSCARHARSGHRRHL
jgi:hypothetical protein